MSVPVSAILILCYAALIGVSNLCSGSLWPGDVTTDPALQGACEPRGPKIMVFIFWQSKNTKFDVTRCDF